MFRSIINENKNELKTISVSVKKIDKFQKDIDATVKSILKQKVGEVKKTLPTAKVKLDECLKKVGDTDLCSIILGKYDKFYGEICQASPAICDDYRPAVATISRERSRQPAEPSLTVPKLDVKKHFPSIVL